MILHIPHAAKIISSEYRDYFVLNSQELEKEMITMVDAYTDELFSCSLSESVIFPYPRLLVDVERFSDNAKEPMSKVGMGMIYTLTNTGQPLKRELITSEIKGLEELYFAHHKKLNAAVTQQRNASDTVMIVDCHSFPSKPLPCDTSQKIPRADFCIGTDSFHTPDALVDLIKSDIEMQGYSVSINEPYSGTMVPMKHYHQDPKVRSIMLEINRELYMNEVTGSKNDNFNEVKKLIDYLLSRIRSFV